MFRITPVVRNLLIVNTVIFIAQMIGPEKEFLCYFQDSPFLRKEGLVTGYFSLWNVHLSCFKPYQFLTYMFAHGSVMHYAFNMLAIASFGPILENYWGEKKFLLFYLVTGIGAGMIYAGVNYIFPEGGGVMLGASGAIYGILMAFGLIFPNLEIMMLIPPIPMKAKYMVFVMGGITYLLDRSGSVAHVAHFGGAIVAFILIRLIWKERGQTGW